MILANEVAETGMYHSGIYPYNYKNKRVGSKMPSPTVPIREKLTGDWGEAREVALCRCLNVVVCTFCLVNNASIESNHLYHLIMYCPAPDS